MSAGPSTNGQPEEKLNLPIPPETISTEAIRTLLERILVSPGFVHSDRMARFLCFAVEQTLQGRADSLKEFVLGMEVFDRTA
jgi:hypothetical protein